MSIYFLSNLYITCLMLSCLLENKIKSHTILAFLSYSCVTTFNPIPSWHTFSVLTFSNVYPSFKLDYYSLKCRFFIQPPNNKTSAHKAYLLWVLFVGILNKQYLQEGLRVGNFRLTIICRHIKRTCYKCFS